MSVSPDQFRHALSRFASGITVVTTRDAAGDPFGITVTAFCSVSLEPPLILVCIEKSAGSHGAIIGRGAFAVNVLKEFQADLSVRFSSPGPDRFEGIAHYDGLDGIPVLQGVLANIECRVADAYDGGDHTIFVGRVERTSISDGRPLVYFEGNYGAIGDEERALSLDPELAP